MNHLILNYYCVPSIIDGNKSIIGNEIFHPLIPACISNGIPNLFLLDELFKGTNTVERISASKAVLSDLNRSNNIVFVSTHDIELADLLKNEYELFHFSEIIGNDSVDFDYKLKRGKLKTRNAIRILEINGYPEQIIKESYEIAKSLDEIIIASNTKIKLVQ